MKRPWPVFLTLHFSNFTLCFYTISLYSTFFFLNLISTFFWPGLNNAYDYGQMVSRRTVMIGSFLMFLYMSILATVVSIWIFRKCIYVLLWQIRTIKTTCFKHFFFKFQIAFYFLSAASSSKTELETTTMQPASGTVSHTIFIAQWFRDLFGKQDSLSGISLEVAFIRGSRRFQIPGRFCRVDCTYSPVGPKEKWASSAFSFGYPACSQRVTLSTLS